MRRPRAMWAVEATLVVALLLGPGRAVASTVTVLGSSLWDEARVTAIVGAPPATTTKLHRWADDALKRLVAAYASEGYAAARGWTRVEGDHVDIEIDEGHIGRVMFRGPNALVRLIMSQAVVLPGDVYEEAIVEAQLRRLEELRGIHGVAWSVREGDEWVRQQIPGAVRAQVLVVEVETVQPIGFGVGIGFDPLYGLLVSPSWARPDVAAPGDRLEIAASVAFPVKEYLFETEPRPRWVYGDLDVEYRMRTIGASSVAPRFGAYGALVQTPRIDRGLEQLMVESSLLRVELVFTRSERWIASAGGFASQSAVLRTLWFDEADPSAVVPPALDDVFRAGVTAGLEGLPASSLIRVDLRPRIGLDAALGWSSANEPYAKIVGDVRGAARLRSNLLLLGLHAGLVGGDVRVYDALRVGGKRQRVIFADLYYSRALAQAEADLRFKIVRDLQIGALYQHTIFEDTLADPTRPVFAWTNAFGPGVHLLLVDQFAIDVYWVMGLAPPSYEAFSPNGGRFSHTISLGVQSAY